MTNLDHLKGHKLPGTRLTFIERMPAQVGMKIRARFLCDCGNEHVCAFNDWVIAKVTSCGCARKEAMRRTEQKTRTQRVATIKAKSQQAPQSGFALGNVSWGIAHAN